MPEAGGKGGVHQQRGSAGTSESGQAGGPNELIFVDKFVRTNGRCFKKTSAPTAAGALSSSIVQTKACASAQANCWVMKLPHPVYGLLPLGQQAREKPE